MQDGSHLSYVDPILLARSCVIATAPIPICTLKRHHLADLKTYHVCRICLKPRSRKYHCQHPIPTDGVPPPPGICRRCRVTTAEESTVQADGAAATASVKVTAPARVDSKSPWLQKREALKLERNPESTSALLEEPAGDEHSNRQSSLRSPLPRQSSTKTSSQIRSQTEQLYLEGRGLKTAANYDSPRMQQYLDEAGMRSIVRDELERSRGAERLLNSHPNPYSHGRIVSMRHDQSAPSDRRCASRSGHEITRKRSVDMGVQRNPPERGRSFASGPVEEVVILRRKRAYSLKGAVRHSTSRRYHVEAKDDSTPLHKETIVFQRRNNHEGSLYQDIYSESHNRERGRDHVTNSLTSTSPGKKISSLQYSGQMSSCRNSAQTQSGHHASPPYPTSDREHISPPSPSRSGLRSTNKVDNDDHEIDDDKTSWPRSPVCSRHTSTPGYGPDDHEYLYIVRTSRAVSPPHSSHVHFDASPERSERPRQTQKPRSRSSTPRHFSPERFVGNIRQRSSAFQARPSRDGNSHQSGSSTWHSNPDLSDNLGMSRSSNRSSRPLYSQGLKQASCESPSREYSRLARGYHEQDQAADRAGYGPYTEEIKLADSMIVQDGSAKAIDEDQQDSVRLQARGLSFIREERHS